MFKKLSTIILGALFFHGAALAETLKFEGGSGEAFFRNKFRFREYSINSRYSSATDSQGSIQLYFLDQNGKAPRQIFTEDIILYHSDSSLSGKFKAILGGNYTLQVKSENVDWSLKFKPLARPRESFPKRSSFAGYYIGAANLFACQSTTSKIQCSNSEKEKSRGLVTLKITDRDKLIPSMELGEQSLVVSATTKDQISGFYRAESDFDSDCENSTKITISSVTMTGAKLEAEVKTTCADGTYIERQRGLLRRG